jgi:hypothetical protein
VNAQEQVLERFPDAEAQNVPPIFEHGATSPLDGGYWAVLVALDREPEELGRGRSETEAWADAAGLLGNQAA